MFKDRVYCGELGISDIDKRIHLVGWVDIKRDLGGIIFIELRDVSGIIQVLVDSSKSPDIFRIADEVKNEYCIKVQGIINQRSEETINPNINTGSIELQVEELSILNPSLSPPIPISSRVSVSEEMRLRYRYLDLRREEMRDAIIKRHILMQSTRAFLSRNRFIEIDTPILNKSTPEGARDFLVPSRINKGLFY